MTFDWDYASSIFPSLCQGALVTVFATVIGMVVAILFGLVLCTAEYVPFGPVRIGVRWIGEFLRDTPLLIQIFALYYILPGVGISLPPFATGVAALGLQYAAYLAETYRAGIESIPRGQWEASRALNFSVVHTWRAIILPQVVRRVIPAIGSFMIGMFKDSPLLFTIGVTEILAKAMDAGGRTYRYTEPILMVGGFFLVMSVVSAVILNLLDKKLVTNGTRV
ncbi:MULTISPECIES: ectoine/hydroxyectoine ABC transporter permease subunit EhuD [unclassified Nocardioides]|uniref:ectoine/hydroxyectoine ABC transporter permease subunit EhuD n=1 Tax=unclassified Nocardioides TaxID=2615069 RepID=UPI0009F14E47|nr:MULTISPECIES: ectoine/hydroxyectoine ABC transporter permease subunit EhuD [unclassified Nocardioides]GAW49611.1 Putative amino acid ABC transporter protein [Nocardioides sp. PD653-B2]GAW57549.1 putative amino acid ABC transporter protein [Nocardioides sp. PD653]